MAATTVLSNLELAIVSMLGSFIITTLVLLAVAIFLYYRKSYSEPQFERLVELTSVVSSKKPLLVTDQDKASVMAPMFSNVKSVYHFKNTAYTMPPHEDSKVTYTLMFRTATEKLALKIMDVTIGGNTQSIKPHMSELREIFFRIQLNNSTTNSMINSEMYEFSANIPVNEVFLFSLKEFQLKSTTVVVDVLVTLAGNKNDLMLGYVEIKPPDNLLEYPITETTAVTEVYHEIDLYVKPLGYVCICLENIHDGIKLQFLASLHYENEIRTELESGIVIFYRLQISSKEDPEFGQTCRTSTKALAPTVIWNEVFVFEIADSLMYNSVISMELWKSASATVLSESPPQLMGIINIGISKDLPFRSRLHWDYIMENESEETFRWHPILRMNNS